MTKPYNTRMMNPRAIPGDSSRIWLWFLGVSTFNLLLFLTPGGVVLKACIGTSGWLAAGWVAYRQGPPPPVSAVDPTIPAIPGWGVAVLGLVALAFRVFFRNLDTCWPTPDETFHALCALNLAETHRFHAFYNVGITQVPPLFFWLEGIWFMVFPPCGWTLWGFPGLLSAAALIFGHRAFQRAFPGSTARLGSFLLAFSFWPIYLFRQNIYGAILIVWALAAWDAYGKWRLSPGPTARAPALALAFWLGTGFWTALHWPLVAGGILAASILDRRRPGKPSGAAFLWLSVLIFGSAYFISAYRNMAFLYPRHLLFGSAPPGDPGWAADQALYLTGLFWKAPGHFVFGPVWSGLYNPLLGSAVLLGAVGALRRWRQPASQALGAALLLAPLPGWATWGVEYYRFCLLIIPLTALAALGLSILAGQGGSRRLRTAGLAAILLVSAGWDFYHWEAAYPSFYRSLGITDISAKPQDRVRAYRILEREARAKGPVLFWNELIVNPEQDLMLLTYPFNAARNPALSPDRAHRWAVLANANLGPYLQREFPEATWIPVSQGLETRSGGLVLGMGPVNPGNRPRFENS